MWNTVVSNLPSFHPWRDRIHCLDTVDSTNTYAKTLAASGAAAGTVVIADRQTGGRGRMGRAFSSPAGMGVYLSLILRPRCAPEDLMHLTCAVGLAACDAVEKVCGICPGIKWTNDLVYDRRKLGGILTELSVNPQTRLVDHAVIGIGINCGQQPADFPPEIRSTACSVAMLTGASPDRGALAAALVDALWDMSASLMSHRAECMARFRSRCVTIGQDISILRGDTVLHGRAIAVDSEGGLLVRFPDGSTQTVTSGEVSIRGMYGYL